MLEKSLLFLSSSFLVHALPLPLVYAAREGPRPAAHVSSEDEIAEELRESSGTFKKDRRRHGFVSEMIDS